MALPETFNAEKTPSASHPQKFPFLDLSNKNKHRKNRMPNTIQTRR
jgi:hypothetical protein